MAHIVIIGGGITGLAAAYSLQTAAREAGEPVRYTILESSDRVGGKIVTDSEAGFVVEGGPDAFITQKPAALELCRSLGLEEQLFGARDADGAFVLRAGRLHQLPSGMGMLAPMHEAAFVASSLLTDAEKERIRQEADVPARASDDDESLASFVERRFGAACLRYIAEPLYGGVYMAEADHLSMAAVLPRLFALEKRHGSLTRGVRAMQDQVQSAEQNGGAPRVPNFMTLRDGLGALVDALHERLRDHLRLNTRVTSLTPCQDGTERIVVGIQGQEPLTADAVIVTAPAPVVADITRQWLPPLSQQLGQIRVASSATVTLGFAPDRVRHALRGTGFVVPRPEPSRLLACTWTSSKFPHRAPEGAVLLRAFISGLRQPDLLDSDDEALVRAVHQDLRAIMDIPAKPDLVRVYRWRNVHPQYAVGHLDRVASIEASCPPNLLLAGASYRGIGLPDCIAQGQAAAARALADVARTAALQA